MFYLWRFLTLLVFYTHFKYSLEFHSNPGWIRLSPGHTQNISPDVSEGHSPLCSAPSRSSSLSGKTLAQGTSSFWMSTPNRKGWGGRVSPSRGWQVGEKKRIPPWSLLPRKLLMKVTLPKSSTNFPAAQHSYASDWKPEQKLCSCSTSLTIGPFKAFIRVGILDTVSE